MDMENCNFSGLNETRNNYRTRATKLIKILKDLLATDRFHEIQNAVDQLKRMKDNIAHCDDSIQILLEQDEFIQDLEKSSALFIDIDKVIEEAESLLDKHDDENFEGKFSGETVEWFGFWESFEEEVHAREDISPNFKLVCLKKRLESWPLNMISQLGEGDTAYDEALKLLQTSFSSKKVLVESHLNALLDLDPPTLTPVSLMRFCSDFEYHIRALKYFETTIEEAGFFVAAILNKKLPKEIYDSINKADRTSYWTLPEFQEELNREVELLNIEFAQKPNNGSADEDQNVEVVGIKDENNSSENSVNKVTNIQTCYLCSENHKVNTCTVYKTPIGKMKRLIQIKLCLICFGADHVTEKCEKPGCKFCKGKHNSLICISQKKNGSNNIAAPLKQKICQLCAGYHDITACTVYTSPAMKMKRTRKLKLCLLCIKDDHRTDECLKSHLCKFCDGIHNSMLCPGENLNSNKEVNGKKNKIIICQLCFGCHDITGCTVYSSCSQKLERAKQLCLCLVCIKNDHTTEKCVKTVGCKLCKGKHNTLLCPSQKGITIMKREVQENEERKMVTSGQSFNMEAMKMAISGRPFNMEEKKIATNGQPFYMEGRKIATSGQPCSMESVKKIKSSFSCELCNGRHQFGGCPKYNTTFKRYNRAVFLNLCQVCLQNTHKTADCSNENKCKLCGLKHNAQFCLYPNVIITQSTTNPKRSAYIKKGSISKSAYTQNGSMNGYIQDSNSTKNSGLICTLCYGNHEFSLCYKYKTSVERRVRAAQLQLCLVCVNDTHTTYQCLKLKMCRFCSARHHTLLCIESEEATRTVDERARTERRKMKRKT